MLINKNLSLSSLFLVRKSSFKNIKITYLIVKIPLHKHNSKYYLTNLSIKKHSNYVKIFFLINFLFISFYNKLEIYKSNKNTYTFCIHFSMYSLNILNISQNISILYYFTNIFFSPYKKIMKAINT